MLTVVAHQEDAKRYKGGVTYWNEQLMPLCGFGGRTRLVLARDKAVRAGWLHYEPGKKARPGIYWTIIPPQYEDLPDTPMDESSDDFIRTEIERQRAASRTESGQNNGDCRPESGRIVGRNPDGNQDGIRTESRTANLHLPNLSPIPTPIPIKYIPARFPEWWQIYPRKDSKAEAEKKYPKAVKAIAAKQKIPDEQAEDWLLEITRLFASSDVGRSGRFCPHGSTWLNQERFNDPPESWNDRGSNGKHDTSRVGPGQRWKPTAAT